MYKQTKSCFGDALKKLNSECRECDEFVRCYHWAKAQREKRENDRDQFKDWLVKKYGYGRDIYFT